MVSPYFSLNPDSIFVTGARRAAIYNLTSGDIFSIDEAGREILELAGEGLSLHEILPRARCARSPDEVDTFLHELQGLKLGKKSPQPHQSDRTHFSLHPKKLRKVWLELTGRCNLRCIHCYADASPHLPHETDLSHARFKELIREAARLGARWTQFIGGEPLLYQVHDLADLIATAREASFDVVEVFTNGTLITDAHLDFFAHQRVQVAVSLYSCEARVHDRITGCPGSFDRTAANLGRLRERGVPFRIGVVVTSLNAHTETKTLEWVRERFGDVFVTSDVVRCNRCGRDGQVSLLTKDLLRRRARTEPDFSKVGRDMFGKALGGNCCLDGEICVSAHGEAYPCIMERSRALGDVQTQSLEEIIEGYNTQSAWGLSKDRVPVCRDCEYRYACRDCPPMSKALAEMLEQRPIDGPVKDPLCTYDPYAGTWGSPDGILERLCAL
jgi:radical SAM protein with 4Fe4S-binding SPASM domain